MSVSEAAAISTPLLSARVARQSEACVYDTKSAQTMAAPASDSRKPKILAKYEELFGAEVLADSFCWDEFFLLRPAEDQLRARLGSDFRPDVPQLVESFRLLLAQAAECIARETTIAVYNAAHTMVIVLEEVCERHGIEFAMNVLMDDAEFIVATVLRRFYFFLVEPFPIELKQLSLFFTERLCLLGSSSGPAGCSLLSRFVFLHAFDVVLAVFAQYDTLADLGSIAVNILALMLARTRGATTKSDPFLAKFSTLHDDVTLQGLAHFVVDQIILTTNHFTSTLANPKGDGVFSKITSLFSSASIDSEEHSDDIYALFVLFESIRLNKAFVSTLLTARSPLEENDDEATGQLLRHFFTFCSFALEDTKSEAGVSRARLSLLIALLLSDDVFIQNSLHDPHNVCSVPLFRSAHLHRKAFLDTKRAPCSLGTTALDLVAELLLSHLKLGFPCELYHLSLGVVHRILAYQKNRCIRMTQWLPLFNAMLALLRFQLSNESRNGESSLPLCYRVIVLVNLFLTFGDTFLPSGEAYDYLYYELVRQEAVFRQLADAVERRLEGDKNADWECASKIKSHLVNPIIIISTVKEKLEQESGELTQENIVSIIRSSFDSLSLKLYDGLTIVAPYDHDQQLVHFAILSQQIYSRRLAEVRANPLQIDYKALVDCLSSLSR